MGISNGNHSEEKLKLKEEFDLREKRLNLVYKILYVLAAVWAALFLSYANGPHDADPIYCGALSFLSTAIINIIFFIFSEIRCLRIATEVTPTEKSQADRAFSDIWNGFASTAFVAVLLTALNVSFPAIITASFISCGFIVGAIGIWVVPLIWKRDSVRILRNILVLFLCYLFFAVAQISSAI